MGDERRDRVKGGSRVKSTYVSGIKIKPELFPQEAVYPFTISALAGSNTLRFDSAVTFFVGENGTGKSTLLESIAKRCNIYIWRGVKRSRVGRNPYEDSFYEFIEVEWTKNLVPGAFFAAELFRNFSQLLDEWASTDPGLLSYYGGRSLLEQSHGQSHISFFESRFALEGVYLLDEPENALSPRAQTVLLDIIAKSVADKKGQFIIATHSPILLSYPGAEIFSFDDSPIGKIAYEETEHFQVYREFFDKRHTKTP